MTVSPWEQDLLCLPSHLAVRRRSADLRIDLDLDHSQEVFNEIVEISEVLLLDNIYVKLVGGCPFR